MKYKGIIFDLDGVLCSTDRFHFEAWKQTAEEVGAPFDETINMKLRGVSRMESLEIILSGSSKTFTDAEKERLATEKNDRYRKLLAQMSPADMPTAVRDALTALHNAGLKLAVGSSSKNAAYILERLDANRYFDAVCDGTMIAHPSPTRRSLPRLPPWWGLPRQTAWLWRTLLPGWRPPARAAWTVPSSARPRCRLNPPTICRT